MFQGGPDFSREGAEMACISAQVVCLKRRGGNGKQNLKLRLYEALYLRHKNLIGISIHNRKENNGRTDQYVSGNRVSELKHD